VPKTLEVPGREELREVLLRETSISGLARHYGVTFTTARKWLRARGFQPLLESSEYEKSIKRLITKATSEASHRRIDLELAGRLADPGDRKLLARSIVDEFSMRYTFKKTYSWRRYILVLTLVMYDLPPVLEVSRLVGVPCRLEYRRAKSGVRVPNWVVKICGYRAFRTLQVVRPYLVGQKAFQADIALRHEGITDEKIYLQKELYKQELLASLGLVAR
jgi:transposase-like protein